MMDRFLGTSLDEIKYRLLTKREFKMAAYWPSSVFGRSWTKTKSRFINSEKKKEAKIQQTQLTETAGQ